MGDYISDLITIIGGMTAVGGFFGLLKVFGGGKDLKTPLIKIAGGLAVAGIGILLRHFFP